MRRLCGIALIATLAVVLPATAHHGISNWDLNTDVTVKGRIARIEFLNPHAWLHVEVTGANGKPEAWKCEMRSAFSLQRSGWTIDMFKAGGVVTVTGSPERTKPRQCYLSTILFADGSSMDRYGQRQSATAEAAKVAAAQRATGPPSSA
jgi:hypothetical protein